MQLSRFLDILQYYFSSMKLTLFNFCIFLLLTTICKGGEKQPFIIDNVKIFSDSEVVVLNNQIQSLTERTSAEVLVYVTSSLNNKTIEKYALEIGNKYGVGKNGINNGIIILLAPNDREMNISVGYGLEWLLPDNKCNTIRDTIINFFGKSEYFHGVEKGLSMMKNYVSGYSWNVESINFNDISAKDTGKILKFHYTNKSNKKFKYALNSDQQFSPEFNILLKTDSIEFNVFYTKYMNSFISKILTEKNITIYARLIDWESKRLDLLGVEE